MSYPTANNLVAAMASYGVTISETDAESAMSAAISEFEMRTGWQPFLADSVASSVVYDAPGLVPGYVLDFGGAFISVSSVELVDTALTLNTDYYLRAVSLGSSVSKALEFAYNPGTGIQTVTVTGVRGRVSTVPADVFSALLGRGCAIASTMSVSALSASRIKQGPVELEFGGGSSGAKSGGKVSELNAQFDKACLRWMRV